MAGRPTVLPVKTLSVITPGWNLRPMVTSAYNKREASPLSFYGKLKYQRAQDYSAKRALTRE